MSDADTSNGASKPTPPYLPFATFDKTLSDIKGRIPPRIDRTMLDSKSGSMQSWIISSLRFFGLIDPAGTPQPILNKLVDAEDRSSLYGELCKSYYADLFATVHVDRATQGQLDEWFRAQGISGSTITKSVAFFLDLAKKGGIPTSSHFKKSKAGGVTTRRRPLKPTAKTSAPEDNMLSEEDPQDTAPALREKIIMGLVEKLPDPSEPFPAAARERWKKAADTIFDMVYGEVEEG